MTVAEIVDVLGGKKTFKQPVKSTDDLARQICAPGFRRRP